MKKLNWFEIIRLRYSIYKDEYPLGLVPFRDLVPRKFKMKNYIQLLKLEYNYIQHCPYCRETTMSGNDVKGFDDCWVCNRPLDKYKVKLEE